MVLQPHSEYTCLVWGTMPKKARPKVQVMSWPTARTVQKDQ